MGKSKRSTSKYSIQIIRELGGLEAIREIWDGLACKQGGYRPFLCFDWFWLWAKHFLRNQELFVLTVSDSREIVCIAPCVRTRQKVHGVGARRIELMGNVYSPFRCFLVNNEGETEIREAFSSIVEYFARDRSSWDVMDFTAIPEEKGWYHLLKETLESRGLDVHDYVAFGDWYLDNVELSGDEYLAQLPKKVRKDVAYCRRRLEKLGEVDCRIVQGTASLDTHVDLYYEVYAKSWQQREGVGPTFHRDLAKMTAEHGWLRLGFLFFNQDPIAAQFWISCQDTSFILKTVYDQDYRKFSPGKLLTTEMMKSALDTDKVKVIDYGHGDEEYKRDWTPQRRERRGILVYNRSLRGRYLGFIQNKLRPAVQKNKYLRMVAERMRRPRGEKISRVSQD